MVEIGDQDRLTTNNDVDEKAEAEQERERENADEEKWEDVLGSGSLLKKIINKGTPDTRPQKLQICELNYTLEINEAPIEERHNFLIQLGDFEVIQGLDLAVGLMNVGEKCELKIEPRLGYGEKGLEPDIPADAKLHYTIELLSVKDEEEPELLSVSQRKIKGKKKRERGNWWYGRGENTLAIQCYRRALDYLDELEGGITDPSPEDTPEVSDRDLQDLLEDRISVCNNMAAAQIKLKSYDAALNSLEIVLRCQPGNVKALYRKAKVFRAKNEYSAALKLLLKAQEVAPNDADISKEITLLSGLIKKQKISEKELAQRMFNMGKADDKRKKTNTKFQGWAIFGASVAVGLMGLAAYKFKYL